MKKLLTTITLCTLVGTSASSLKPVFTNNVVSHGFKSNQANNKDISIKNENDTNPFISRIINIDTNERVTCSITQNGIIYVGTSFDQVEWQPSTELLAKHNIILFSLNSLSYPKLASNMGKLLIQDLKEFASLKPRNQHINLFLDEFNVFASDTIINLINKTRSFNYQCFLCFQVTDDLSTDKKKLLNTIFGNVGNIIVHKISDVESPKYIAKVFGTRTVEKITKQYDTKNKKRTKGSIREVEKYIAHPNDLKNLKVGQAYCKILLPSSKQCINKINIENYINE